MTFIYSKIEGDSALVLITHISLFMKHMVQSDYYSQDKLSWSRIHSYRSDSHWENQITRNSQV